MDHKAQSWKDKQFARFVTPTSYPEAETRFNTLLGEIQNIEAQLGDKAKKAQAYSQGEPFIQEYLEWHRRALGARNGLAFERRFVKMWMSENKPQNPTGVLREVYALLLRLKDEGVDYTPDEVTLINLFGSMVESNPSKIKTA